MRSARYRDFLQPQGYDDELRVMFRTGDRSWGAAGLFREAGRDPFDEHDVAVLEAISPIVAAAFRTHAALAVPTPGLSHTPGLMLFDRDGAILSANDAASTGWPTSTAPIPAPTGSSCSPACTPPTSGRPSRSSR